MIADEDPPEKVRATITIRFPRSHRYEGWPLTAPLDTAEDLKEVLAAKRRRRRIEELMLSLQSGVEFLVKRLESQVSKQRGG